MQLALELITLITPSYQVKILTGHTLYMVMSMKSFLIVGSTQVHFLMCTLEIPQKIAAQVLALNFLLFALLLSFSLNYELILYFHFFSFIQSYGSFNHVNSTSLSFSEFSELFTSILLLSQHIESHFALSSARCHF